MMRIAHEVKQSQNKYKQSKHVIKQRIPEKIGLWEEGGCFIGGWFITT